MDEGTLFVVIFTGVWSLVGVIFLIIGLCMLRACRIKRERCSQRVQGTVRELAPAGLQLSPVIDYTVYGKTYSVRSQRGYLNPPFAIGDSVEVQYNGDSPSEAIVDGFSAVRLLGRIFSLVGAAALAIGWGVGLLVKYLAF